MEWFIWAVNKLELAYLKITRIFEYSHPPATLKCGFDIRWTRE